MMKIGDIKKKIPKSKQDDVKYLTYLLKKILNSMDSSWQSELLVGGKRLTGCLSKKDNPLKKKSDELGISLDLNLVASGNADDDASESWNSSDLKIKHDHCWKIEMLENSCQRSLISQAQLAGHIHKLTRGRVLR